MERGIALNLTELHDNTLIVRRLHTSPQAAKRRSNVYKDEIKAQQEEIKAQQEREERERQERTAQAKRQRELRARQEQEQAADIRRLQAELAQGSKADKAKLQEQVPIASCLLYHVVTVASRLEAHRAT